MAFVRSLADQPHTGRFHGSVGFPFQASYEEAVDLTGASAYPTFHVKAETGLDYNASPVLRRMTRTDANNRASGNYVQFDNVAPAVDGSFVVSTTWESTNVGNTHQPAVNAIQLVKVGPATVSRPSVTAAVQGSNLTLTWGASAAGFTLESSPVLGPGAAWQAVTGAPNPITAAGSTTASTTAGASGYYRLKKAN